MMNLFNCLPLLQAYGLYSAIIGAKTTTRPCSSVGCVNNLIIQEEDSLVDSPPDVSTDTKELPFLWYCDAFTSGTNQEWAKIAGSYAKAKAGASVGCIESTFERDVVFPLLLPYIQMEGWLQSYDYDMASGMDAAPVLEQVSPRLYRLIIHTCDRSVLPFY